jgi:hypothetical protein
MTLLTPTITLILAATVMTSPLLDGKARGQKADVAYKKPACVRVYLSFNHKMGRDKRLLPEDVG